MTTPHKESTAKDQRQKAVALLVIAVCAVMFGLAFASVPLYRMFCAATGYGGTPQIVKAAVSHQGARTLKVQFDTNVAPGLPWIFEPETNAILLRTGQTATVFFKVSNKSDATLAATAAFNVAPENAGAFFDKISCFCFAEQKLGPHESAELPVVFYLDPTLEQDESMLHVDEITLSYTFFGAKNTQASASGETSSVARLGRSGRF